MKYFAYIVIAIVAAAIIGAFFVVGSPMEARLKKFDEQKISNLQTIQSEITNYWQSKRKLPNMLSELNDSLRGFSTPKDPQTGQEYEYSVNGPESFALCSVFNRSAMQGKGSALVERIPVPVGGGYYGDEYWTHGEGRTCFERTIDKDYFPPIKAQRATD